jgi:hypothetical protein
MRVQVQGHECPLQYEGVASCRLCLFHEPAGTEPKYFMLRLLCGIGRIQPQQFVSSRPAKQPLPGSQ